MCISGPVYEVMIHMNLSPIILLMLFLRRKGNNKERARLKSDYLVMQWFPHCFPRQIERMVFGTLWHVCAAVLTDQRVSQSGTCPLQPSRRPHWWLWYRGLCRWAGSHGGQRLRRDLSCIIPPCREKLVQHSHVFSSSFLSPAPIFVYVYSYSNIHVFSSKLNHTI